MAADTTGPLGPQGESEGQADKKSKRAKGARPTMKVESLEPRILMSATWADAHTHQTHDGATAGDDAFTGDAGNDFADAGAGDDILHGGAGDNTLIGGSGHDTADYADSSTGIHADMTTGHVHHGGGDDTLSSIEHVTGSAHDDVFSFDQPTSGAVYEVDGGGGSNSIDLSHYDASHVHFSNGQVQVDMAGGGSFTVKYDHVDSIQFGDVSASVLGAGSHTLDAAHDHMYIEGDHAFRLNIDGAGNAHAAYNSDTHALSITGVDSTDASSTLHLTNLAGHTTLDHVTVDSPLGAIHSDTNIGTLEIGAHASVGEVTIGDGHGTIHDLVLSADVDHAHALDVHASVDTLHGAAIHADLEIHGDVGAIALTGGLDHNAALTIHGAATSVDIGGTIGAGSSLHIEGGVDHLKLADAAGSIAVDGNLRLFEGGNISGHVEIQGDVDTVHLTSLSGTFAAHGVSGLLDFQDGAHQHPAYFASSGNFMYDGTTHSVIASDETHADWFDPAIGSGGYQTFSAMASDYNAFATGAEHTITFSGLASGTKLGEQYHSSDGVSFSNTAGGQYNAYSGAHQEDDPNVEHLTGYDGTFAPDHDNVYLKFDNNNPNAPFTINFDQPVSQVSAFLACGKEGTDHRMQISIYDTHGTLIQRDVVDAAMWDATSANQNNETFFGVKLDQAVIGRVEILNLSQTNFSNALMIDSLKFSHAPAATHATVDAGADVTANERDIVELKGSLQGARPQDVTVTWVQTGGPTVQLSDAHALRPTFIAPDGTTNSSLSFEMRVTRGGQTMVDAVAVQIHAVDDAPVVNAGNDVSTTEGALVQLQGHATDSDSPALTHTWVQVGGPTVTLSDAHAANPTFTAPNVVGTANLQFELHVSDGHSTTVDTMVVHVNGANEGPVADAGHDQYVYEGNPVTLSAAGSHDNDVNDTMTFSWRQVGGPTVALSDSHASMPTFTAPGTTGITKLSFEVTVTDASGATHTDVVDIAVGDPQVESYVHGLNYTQFRNLNADQVDYLTPQQVASIPNSDWFATMSADARASLDATQLHAIDTSHVSIGYLNSAQREFLTHDQVQHLPYTDFRYLSATGVDHLSAAQVATIPNSDWFATMSADARASLDATQVQGLDTSHVSIGYLNASQREFLTHDQVQHLPYTDFRYLSATGVDHLTPQQVASIPNSDWFATMSADARASLDATQVQGLDTSHVSIGYLNASQREFLTHDQVQHLPYTDFRYLSATGVDHLSAAQVATIPNSDWFATMSADARASLDTTQVQALNTTNVSIGYLTADQREWLTHDQIQHLSYTQFRYLSANGVDHLSAAQVATIPNSDWFATMSASARGSLDQTQVQGLNAANVSIGYLTADQREWLTHDQIQRLGYTQFRYLSATGVDHLSAAQVATIPNSDWFATMSASARGSLDQTQVQGLNTANVSIGYLTADQREWLTHDQIQRLGYTQFRYLSATGVDHLSAAQVATIPNSDWFATMSASARGSLDQTQVQGLNTANVSIGYLTADQREWLTTSQLRAMNYTQFRYVPVDRIAELSAAQMASIPNADWFNTMSLDQRQALTFDQIRAVSNSLTGVAFVGGNGNDALTGNTNVNKLVGGAGNDTLSGGESNDVLDGGSGADNLNGGGGRDLLIAGGGNDVADGGAGNDSFMVENPQNGDVYTFDGGADNDTIDLHQYASSQATIHAGTITINMGGGQSFTINHSNAESVVFSDVTMQAVYNAPPTGIAGNVSTQEGTPATIQLTGSDMDVGDAITQFRIESLPSHGSLMLDGHAVSAGDTVTPQQIADGKLEFRPDENWSGDSGFTFRASDGQAWSQPAEFALHVAAVDDPPTVDAGADQSVAAGVQVTLQGTAQDVDSTGLSYHWVQVAGPTVTLTDEHNPLATFTAPSGTDATQVRFELHVSDGHATTVDTVAVQVAAQVAEPPPSVPPSDPPPVDSGNHAGDSQPPVDSGNHAGESQPPVDSGNHAGESQPPVDSGNHAGESQPTIDSSNQSDGTAAATDANPSLGAVSPSVDSSGPVAQPAVAAASVDSSPADAPASAGQTAADHSVMHVPMNMVDPSVGTTPANDSLPHVYNAGAKESLLQHPTGHRDEWDGSEHLQVLNAQADYSVDDASENLEPVGHAFSTTEPQLVPIDQLFAAHSEVDLSPSSSLPGDITLPGGAARFDQVFHDAGSQSSASGASAGGFVADIGTEPGALSTGRPRWAEPNSTPEPSISTAPASLPDGAEATAVAGVASGENPSDGGLLAQLWGYIRGLAGTGYNESDKNRSS